MILPIDDSIQLINIEFGLFQIGTKDAKNFQVQVLETRLRLFWVHLGNVGPLCVIRGYSRYGWLGKSLVIDSI